MIGFAHGLPGVHSAGTALRAATPPRGAAPGERSADSARRLDRVLTLELDAHWRQDLDALVRAPEWLAASTVLDLGAGNGDFGRRIAARFPLKSIVGLEADAALHAIGARTAAPPNYAYLHGTFDERLDGYFDVLLARGVLRTMPLPERRTVARWASEHCAAALIANNFPEALSVKPPLSFLDDLIARTDWDHPPDGQVMRRDHELADTPRMFADAGLALAGSSTAVSDLSGPRGRLLAHHVVRTSAELIDPAAVTDDVLDELLEWSHRDDARITMATTWHRFRNTAGPWRTLAAS